MVTQPGCYHSCLLNRRVLQANDSRLEASLCNLNKSWCEGLCQRLYLQVSRFQPEDSSLKKVSVGKSVQMTSSQAAFGAASGSASIRPFLSDFSFPVMNLQEPVTLTLIDAKTDEPVGRATISVPSIVEKGFRDEFVNVTNGGRIHVVTTFVLTDEERAKIAAMRKKRAEAAAAAAAGNKPTAPGPGPTASKLVPAPAANGAAAPAPASAPARAPAPAAAAAAAAAAPAPVLAPSLAAAAPASALAPAPAAVAVAAAGSPSTLAPKPLPHVPSPANDQPHVRISSPARADTPVRAPSPSASPRTSIERDGSGSHYVPMPAPSPPTNRGAASPASESSPKPTSASGQSEVDTSPFEQVRIRIKAIEQLKKEMEKAPAGSLSREQARERLKTETEALAAAEELRRQELRRRGINPGNVARREASEYSEMETNEGGGNPLQEIPLIVKQVAGGIAAVLALVLLWPRGRRRPRPRGVYVVKPGDRLAGLVPEHYCHPDSNFYALNTDICELNYIYEGQRIYLP